MQAAEKLTGRQQQVLAFFTETFRASGSPPTIRTVMREFGFDTPRGAETHLKALARKGYLTHEPRQTPAYRPRFQHGGSRVPILGRAPAGHAAEQFEDFRGQLELPWRFSNEAFAVVVVGESMRDANITEGDIAVVDPRRLPNDRDIVLAMLSGEQTIKRLRKAGERFELHPENPAFTATALSQEGDRVVGTVMALVRHLNAA